MRSSPPIAIIVTLLLLAPQATAQSGALPDLERLHFPAGRTGIIALPGSLRLIGGTVGQVDIHAEDPNLPVRTPQDDFAYMRLRLRPSAALIDDGFFRIYKASFDAELHVFPFGQEAPAGFDYDPRWELRSDSPEPRLTEASILLAGHLMAIQAGLVRSHFGLGTVSNAGEDAPSATVRQSPFGYGREGDRVLMLQLAFFPLGVKADARGDEYRPLSLVLQGNGVVDDDTSSWSAGDRTYQALLGVLFQEAGFSGAAGGVYRRQSHAEGGVTEVAIFAATLAWQHTFGDLRLWGEGELAGYVGQTTLSQSALVSGPYDILALGGLGRLGLSHEYFEVAVETGVASGDDNPFDQELHSFSFDREHRVGLLMFSEATRAASAIDAYNVTDETYRAEPPRGFDRLASGGAIRNAIYLNPRVAARPIHGLTLTLGYLFAVSEEPWVDAFRTGVNGGEPTGPRGAVGETELGHEIDVGLEYDLDLGAVGLRARAQLAWYRPGAVFDTEDGDPADDMLGFWLQLEGSW